MRTSAISLALLGLAACGCMAGKDDESVDAKTPGESLGFFAVTGKLGASDETCGAEALGAPSTWSFEVKLSRDGSALYWLNGREAIVGEIDKAGSFGFDTRLDTPLAPRRGAAKGCTIVRADSAKGTLAKSADAFSATLAFAYSETADSDCSEWTTGTQGLPQTLPCRMSYALKAERIGE